MKFSSKMLRVFPAVIVLAVLVLSLCLQHRSEPPATPPIVSFTGQTMGTLYSIKLAGADLSDRAKQELHRQIETALTEVNRQMSVYMPESEISDFNGLPANIPLPVSDDFRHVVQFARTLAGQTSGAFDPTVGPLVNLWGFGPQGRRKDPPTPEAVEAARSLVGYQYLDVSEDGNLMKSRDGLYLDLGAVAKGFGVDKVYELLQDEGYRNILVEIGGETRCHGRNAEGKPWRIGVQRPNYHAFPGTGMQGIVELTNGAVATSGDYQNFFQDAEGRYFSHIIDPRTAQPAGHALASVSVFAGTCMEADGLATALYVLGPEDGSAFIESYAQAEALFVVRESENSFREHPSSGFTAATGYVKTSE